MPKVLEQKLKLNNGTQIPIIGLGTYKLTDEQETYQAVLTALKNGYRHLDTAQYYGNEVIIGKAIKDSGVPRAEIFITSKIWNSDHDYEKALKQVDEILERLQLDYLDLCLIHWPTPKRLECYRALEEQYQAGKLKAIGVSNFEVSHLEELLQHCKVKPMVNQIELHPGLNNSEVLAYCRSHQIVVESWSTMMQGKASEVPVIVEIAKKHNKNVGQVCLKWAIQQEIVVLPKSSHEERIISNAQLDNFWLDDSDMYSLFTIPEQRLGPDPNNFDF
ncbi:aldo/keto reductase [Spiroplasma sp. DGKH1]|uniref:aldo/keto reductase n=1 Tax=Spiroplasma sp. DGKH1 TaxID=3050074 RepID=UPI0034C5C931